MEEWNKHFRRLLGEMGWRVMRREDKIGGEEKREIKKREISKVIRSLKEKKRRGVTGY